MSEDYRPHEGSIFIMSYTECDYENEGNAALVYVLNGGRLIPLLGLMDLPDGTYFNHYDTLNYDKAVAIVVAQKVTHVFTPQFDDSDVDFYGQTLGYSELTDIPNDEEEIECWFEIGSFMYNWEIVARLEALKIRVININPVTKEIIV